MFNSHLVACRLIDFFIAVNSQLSMFDHCIQIEIDVVSIFIPFHFWYDNDDDNISADESNTQFFVSCTQQLRVACFVMLR